MARLVFSYYYDTIEEGMEYLYKNLGVFKISRPDAKINIEIDTMASTMRCSIANLELAQIGDIISSKNMEGENQAVYSGDIVFDKQEREIVFVTNNNAKSFQLFRYSKGYYIVRTIDSTSENLNKL